MALSEILNDLDEQMLRNFNEYASQAIDAWENFSGNEGQMSIVEQHVLETVQEHIEQAKEEWPYGASANDYYAAVMSCFDPDVMNRAFSETIESTYSTMYEYWAESVVLQIEHEDVMAVMGGTAAPHSTAGNWGGS